MREIITINRFVSLSPNQRKKVLILKIIILILIDVRTSGDNLDRFECKKY